MSYQVQKLSVAVHAAQVEGARQAGITGVVDAVGPPCPHRWRWYWPGWQSWPEVDAHVAAAGQFDVVGGVLRSSSVGLAARVAAMVKVNRHRLDVVALVAIASIGKVRDCPVKLAITQSANTPSKVTLVLSFGQRLR